MFETQIEQSDSQTEMILRVWVPLDETHEKKVQVEIHLSYEGVERNTQEVSSKSLGYAEFVTVGMKLIKPSVHHVQVVGISV